MTAAALTIQQRILRAPPQWWLGMMLIALHGGLAWGIEEWWSRALLLAHMGLFLIWQPVWRGERELGAAHVGILLVVGLWITFGNSWWLMAIWLSVLFGLIGGNVPGVQQRAHRVVSLFAAVYVLSMLLVWVVPHLFNQRDIDPLMAMVVRYGLIVVPAVILLVRVERARGSQPLAVDLFYSMLLFLLVAALVLGSFVVKEISRTNYALALAQTLFGIAVLLLTLSWLWNPRSGFAGIGQILSRYLLSLGLPFERWMQNLAAGADQEADPERFLSRALESMLELPWVAGVVWKTKAGAGEFGVTSKFSADLGAKDLDLTIFTRWSLSPSLLLHLKLLARLLSHFYEAKRREQLQRQNAYTQAIYETGARLTHDVKNLLQSLKSLCVAAESSSPAESQALQGLMQRQLPQITQRLQSTLDKLRAPATADKTRVDAAAWWDGLRNRYSRSAISFSASGLDGASLPADLFDSVADNLIQNALAKSIGRARVEVTVELAWSDGNVRLRVGDTGAAVPDSVARQLFGAPVPSQTGLGIGLYQAARQATTHGFVLTLLQNEQGGVVFELARMPDQPTGT
jgi:signal transduction histidine kinase